MTDATKGKKMVWQSFEAPPMPERFAKLCQLDPMLESIWQEVNHPRYRRDPNFCRNQLWNATPRQSGGVGLKFLLTQRVGAGAAVEALHTEEAWLIACAALKQAMPPCAHAEGETWTWKDSEGNVGHGQEETCTYVYPLEKGDRFEGQGISSVIDRLNEWAGGPKAPILDLTKVPQDLKEPVFVVNSYALASALYNDLKFADRLQAGKITQWYHDHAFFVCDEHVRQWLCENELTPETITGPLAWKPVVLAFDDMQLEGVFAGACKSVTMIDFAGRYTAGKQFVTLETFRAEYSPFADDIGIPDMSVEVLDGGLGEICRTHMPGLPIAYAWPALLLAASVYIQARGKFRTNLYMGTIGPANSGKSSAMKLAAHLLGLTSTEWEFLQAGSFEGLAQQDIVTQAKGANRLVWVDELTHLLQKIGIQNATFASNLNTVFYEDSVVFAIAHGKKINWSCRLSLGGGLPEESFSDLFGAATISGLYDRFLFSMCPTGFAGYKHMPLEDIKPVRSLQRPQPPRLTEYEDVGTQKDWFAGDPNAPTSDASVQQQTTVLVDGSVYSERNRWIDELKVSPRCVEIALRAAFICAAFDGRTQLTATDLEPALALAQYQDRIRRMLAPNPGKDDIAIIQGKIMQHLLSHAPHGEWINRRKMLQAIRAYDWDLAKVEKAINNLVGHGDVVDTKVGRQRVIKLVVHKNSALASA